MSDKTVTSIDNPAADCGPHVEVPESSNKCPHEHEWVVYSTALAEVWLMVQCVECNTMGTIDDPSTEEWSEASPASSNPYRWLDATRVREHGVAAPRVIRDVVGPPCSCPIRPGLITISGYARIPGGIGSHQVLLTDAEKSELLSLANLVGKSDLCSHLLPVFIRSFEEHTGSEQSAATHEIVGRIECRDTVGIHCSPSAVARIISEYANFDPIP